MLPNIVGVHGGIPKVKGLAELCENRLNEPIPPTNFSLDVVLISNISVGIKPISSETVELGTIVCDTMRVVPDVEATVAPEGEVI